MMNELERPVFRSVQSRSLSATTELLDEPHEVILVTCSVSKHVTHGRQDSTSQNEAFKEVGISWMRCYTPVILVLWSWRWGD